MLKLRLFCFKTVKWFSFKFEENLLFLFLHFFLFCYCCLTRINELIFLGEFYMMLHSFGCDKCNLIIFRKCVCVYTKFCGRSQSKINARNEGYETSDWISSWYIIMIIIILCILHNKFSWYAYFSRFLWCINLEICWMELN